MLERIDQCRNAIRLFDGQVQVARLGRMDAIHVVAKESIIYFDERAQNVTILFIKNHSGADTQCRNASSAT